MTSAPGTEPGLGRRTWLGIGAGLVILVGSALTGWFMRRMASREPSL
ncbi:hypothetical protein ABZU75_19485 [Streptosporangium sp. NPDC005286]